MAQAATATHCFLFSLIGTVGIIFSPENAATITTFSTIVIAMFATIKIIERKS